MINSTDVNDLQLEDVEDYSTDYPPAGFPQSENIAAVGMPVVENSSKKRTSRLVYLMRTHKWTTGLVFLVVLLLIVVVSIVGGSSAKTSASLPSTSGSYVQPIHIDPKDIDPKVIDNLMAKLLPVYERHGLNATVLDESAGLTPQKKAFYWLAASDLSEFDHTRSVQRYAMACLYYATNAVPNPYIEKPRPWVSAHLWLSTSHVCEWKGIVCNSAYKIEEINLERNNLSGSIPPEIAMIASTLQTLDMTSNSLYMEGAMFDVFSHLTMLTSLLLDDNYMYHKTGLPSEFKMMDRLQKLRLSYNLFSGELEKEHKVLASMTQLTHLEIESNFLTGTMPSVIGQLTNLVYLYMRRNEMRYNLDFLKGGKLTDLFALWLDSNVIAGTIPTEIGLLTGLASISITNSTLRGPIPSELGNLTGLRRLWLYDNHLSGSIPTVLNQLTLLEVLELHRNNFTGAMPQGICANVQSSAYAFKSLTSDCVKEVQCDSACCTECY